MSLHNLFGCLLFGSLLTSFVTAQPNVAKPAKIKQIQLDEKATVDRFDTYVQQAMRDWHVPGMTVTVVQNGRTVYKKGYGVRQLTGAASGQQANAVDTQTLFAMASTTKAMTAACLGMLVDEGKLRWDDPVQQYLPEFQLYDPAVTREIRVRDLLIHDTGVGNADFLWTIMQVPSEEVLRRMRYVKPSYSLRSGFIYQNIMYLAAGKVIEKVSGQPWATFIRQRIFEPLGMSRTQALFRDVTDVNRALPHVAVRDTVRMVNSRVEEGCVDAVGPAGSVWSCADDLTAWMQCMLDSGRYNGKQLLKPTTWVELLKPQTLVPDGQFYPTQQLTRPTWKTYALGWFQHDYRGQVVNFHTGSLTGMTAIHGQLPVQRLAVYVQANLDHAELRHALLYKAFDTFGGAALRPGPDRDWSADFLKLYGRIKQQAEAAERKVNSARVKNTRPSLPTLAYTGTYDDPLYGTVVVTERGGKLRFSANSLVNGSLNHWHYDTYRLTYDDFWNGTEAVSFGLGADGNVAKLTWGAWEFTRKPMPPAAVAEQH